MQLVDQKKRSSREELEPVLYSALIDSMCQNFWPMFIGTVCTAAAAVMTALKTGNVLLWPFVVLIIGIGTARAFQMRKYERRTTTLTFQQAKYWEPRYTVGALVYAGVLGTWCFITIYGNDDPIAHMVCVAVTIGYTAGGAARNYQGRGDLSIGQALCDQLRHFTFAWRETTRRVGGRDYDRVGVLYLECVGDSQLQRHRRSRCPGGAERALA